MISRTIIDIPIEKLFLHVPSFKGLKNADEWRLFAEHVLKLTDDIKKNGLKQPLVVEYFGNGFYEIMDGQRRAFALSILEYKTVPCIEWWKE